jgi:hypothetical protein
MSIRKAATLHFRHVLCLAVLAALFDCLAQPAAAADVWLASDDPVVQVQKHKQTPADYMDLFKPDSSWPKAATRVTAFKISTQFALHSTDEQLTTLISDLRRRHIALAIEAGLLVGSERCGMGVEGYGLANSVENVAIRIQKYGGQLDYIAFDEPVWHGHEGKGRTGNGHLFCSDSIASLVDQIVPKLAILHKYFPTAVFGDIDPIHGAHPEVVQDVVEFFDLLNQKSPIKISFFHADIAWQVPGWQPYLERLSLALHQRGIRVGVICDGGASEVKGREARTNEEWVHTAIQRCQALAANPSIGPEQLIVQSWEPLPTQMLPETNPGALTYEVNALSRFAR